MCFSKVSQHLNLSKPNVLLALQSHTDDVCICGFKNPRDTIESPENMEFGDRKVVS